MALPVGPHLLQLSSEMRNALPDHAAVSLKLRLAGTTDTHATCRTARAPASLSCQVRPGPRETRQSILVLGQLHLERALACVSVLGKDVQDHGCTIEQLGVIAEPLLQLALVAGRQLIVKEHDIGACLVDPLNDLLDLAWSNERGWVRVNKLLYGVAHDDHAGRMGQSL
jgi:hypothetical protein